MKYTVQVELTVEADTPEHADEYAMQDIGWLIEQNDTLLTDTGIIRAEITGSAIEVG